MLDTDVIRDSTRAARMGPRIVQVGISEVQVGIDPDHADIFGEGPDDRGREAVLATDHDRNLSRSHDVGGHLRDPADHLGRRAICGRVAEVRHGDVGEVSLVVHHEGLVVVRGLPDRPRGKARAAAEGTRAVVGDAEKDDASRVVRRDGVREMSRGHPRTETAWAYLRTTPFTARKVSAGRGPRCTALLVPAPISLDILRSPGVRTSRTSRGP